MRADICVHLNRKVQNIFPLYQEGSKRIPSLSGLKSTYLKTYSLFIRADKHIYKNIFLLYKNISSLSKRFKTYSLFINIYIIVYLSGLTSNIYQVFNGHPAFRLASDGAFLFSFYILLQLLNEFVICYRMIIQAA